jgi:hypothetical protein
MKKAITLLLTVATVFFANAQHRNCGAMEHMAMLKAQDPTYEQTLQQLEDFTAHFIEEGGGAGNGRAVITIPVVVHVVYNTSAQNVSDAQIQSQINILNQDFRKLNSDWTVTPSVFQGLVADCEINFCMAQRDPNGNATNGIVRKQTTVTSFSTNDAVKKSAQGGDDAWPSGSYLNLWVCNLSGGVLGYAQFPGGPAATDGVVITYTGFGNTGTAAAPFNKGRTATHEVGHWLNLYHIWGDDGTSCTGTDNCGDTPNQADENYGCPAFPAVSCSNGPNGDMFMNYMDYTDDACMFMFTAGQKARMQALFAAGGLRASLATSLGCTAPSGGGTTCGTPSSLTATGITTTGATLGWSAVSGATSYNVQYKTNAATTWLTTTSTTNSKALTGLTAGTVYNFKVQAVCSTTGAYSAAVNFTTTSVTPACSDTYESNNSQSAAKTIAVNTNITALLSTSSDIDWFKFSNTTAQKNIRITLSNLPADYDVRLYRSNGTLLYTSQNGSTTSETIKYNNATVGTYYIRVYGYNGAFSATSCYTLNASISSTAFREEETEANVIDPAKQELGFVMYPNPSNGIVNLQLNVNELQERVSVKVFDMTGNLIRNVEYTDMQGSTNVSLDMSDVANGIYNVVVAGGSATEVKRLILTK